MKLNYGINNYDAYAFLPAGAVKADSWLKKQLEMLRDNLTLQMESFPDYKDSEWLGTSGENWERGPYYLRGLVSLAFVLDDSELKSRAQKWIQSILKSQRESGMFGPVSNEDAWSRMPVLMALRDYLEAKEYRGESDPKIIPFMKKYFEFQLVNLPQNPLKSWARARGGDNIDSVYWLYNRLCNGENNKEYEWLLRLCDILAEQTQNWREIMNNTTVREHVVNTSQALKMPVLRYMQTGDERDKAAFENALFNMNIDHGRSDLLPNSDEAARDNMSTRGSELCAIVEGMLSSEIALRILKESYIGDRLESLAYNALPNGYSYDYKGHVYYILQNQLLASKGYHGFDCDHGDSSAFGAPCGFDCCFSNNHMGWPKFVQSMWMASKKGIVAAAYGPSSVNYDGISFKEVTNYPFDSKITLIYEGEDKDFELSLRIPEWCESPLINVNNEQLKAEKGTFLKVQRQWRAGDICKLDFPMEIRKSRGYNGSSVFYAGPLLYTLPVKERWSTYSDNCARELKVSANGITENKEARAAGKWNYGVLEDSELSLERDNVALHPFTPDSAPCKIKVAAAEIPEWKLMSNVAAPVPYRLPLEDKKICELELIPYGCTRLKITHIPTLNGKNKLEAYIPERKIRQGRSFYEFSNITLPKAENYNAVIKGEGEGELCINGKAVIPVKFEKGIAKIRLLKSLISERDFAFDFEHYNNIRVYGAKADILEIVPVNPLSKIAVKELTVSSCKAELLLNISGEYCSYKVSWGEKSGEYTCEAEGFSGERAVISALESSKHYFAKVSGFLNGVYTESAEITFDTLENDREDTAVSQLEILGVYPFYEGVSVEYKRVPNAEYYEIWRESAKGEINKRICGFIFNPYKGSHCFESDVLSFSADGDIKKQCFVLKAFKNGVCIASSKKIKFNL